ncbi:MAG: 2-hydroxymuconic semialdehyde dehydrogenase [Halobacteriovoraceae bacterium]|nr:2-hydroxymuconic semialdehyde dehydrogenase [Halobacteriovoraceae bacterium]|tara:strand:- start:6949 stop:8367 length:1419 start_codon:yes stop_codon:yes gene_type:complete
MKITNYIAGIEQTTTDYIPNINPATGEVYGEIPRSKREDVELAVRASKEAFKTWSKLSQSERSKYLHAIADDIEKNLEDYARAECIDNGKPISLARSVDIPRSIQNFRFFADEILKFGTESFNTLDAGENTVYYSPLGVVACISPWNLPLYLFSWKVAPALASGNTVVAKPSEVTPMTAYMLGKTCERIGLPPGVLNIVHGLGHEVGEAISTHQDILAISFTGSTMTGQKIAEASASTMKRLHLEMGGKNATIVFSDCDYEKTLETTLRAAFANQGQICLCGSRILVEKSIYEKFKTDLVAKVNGLKQGDPLDESSQQGAVVSKAHFDKILKAIETAKSEGGKILTGGKALKEPGFFIMPTLIEGLNQNCLTNQEEIFGPVATIEPFESEEEVINMANANRYGLAGSLWTQDIEKAKRVALQIDSGILWINTWLLRDLRTPFGGMKDSGRGREGGQYILKFFSNTKNICINR